MNTEVNFAMNYSFLIVDDEAGIRDYIATLVIKYYPEARIVGSVGNAVQARKILLEEEVNVMLLDIGLPGETGMELLQSLKTNGSLKIIFITGHIDYTIPAIKHSIFDYVLKPIDKQEFKNTIERLLKTLDEESSSALSQNAQQSYMNQKLALHHSKGFRFVPLGDIVYLKASNSYTHIQLSNDAVVIVSKPLKEFQAKLNPSWFFRIHKSYIVNMIHIDQYISEDGGLVLMKNGEKIYISRYKLIDFFNIVAAFTKGLKA